MSILQALDYFGVFVFAISGISAAAGRQIDLFGGVIIAFVTALGGGTIRDILLKADIAWMHDTTYLYTVITASILTLLFQKHVIKLRKSLFFFDSLGIGLFTIVGLQKSLALDFPIETSIILGVVSATFGGVVRDILCGEIPLLFRKEIYGTACLLGAIVYVFLSWIQIDQQANLIISILIIFIIRLIAVYSKVSMPIINDKY